MAEAPSAADLAFRTIVNRHERQFRTVGDMVYEVLRESIQTGVFAPGERLRQDQLAEQLGVSRIPVRSALMQLETEGLITVHPYRGATVSELSADEMRENYEIRGVLEGLALRKAAAAMTPERMKELKQLAQELNDVRDGEDFLRMRMRFYHELYDGDHHPQLVALIEKLRNDAGRYWLQRHVDYVSPPGERDHGKILDFLDAEDLDGAVRWQQEHLDRVGRQLTELMAADAERVASSSSS
jgi:DNA-binding GntR family transcriptional regulator